MKHLLRFLILVAFGAATAVFTRAANAVPAASSRVGVYDSRLVAYAHFWTDAEQRRISELAAMAQTAREQGDTAAHEARSRALREHQDRIHLQVFSTAPATFALAALQPRLPALLAELGVERLVSKWDPAALQGIPEANRIDVTDRLVAEFAVPPRRAQALASMRSSKPLPLAEAQRLVAAGKL